MRSTNSIHVLAYDAARRELSLIFADGRCVAFIDVPPVVERELAMADDADGYFESQLRGRYTWREISDWRIAPPGSIAFAPSV